MTPDDTNTAIEVDAFGDGRISIGAWDRGNGTVVTMSTEEAREIAATIVKAADEIDAETKRAKNEEVDHS